MGAGGRIDGRCGGRWNITIEVLEKMLSITRHIAVLSLLWAPISAGTSSDTDRTPFLQAEDRLPGRVEFTDAQEGFAGNSGTITSIEPDGSFQVARFLNEIVREPHHRGQLTGEELKALTDVLSEQRWSELPSQMGQRPTINPHRVAISYAEKRATIVLAPGQSIEEALAALADDRQSPEFRFLRIAQAIRDLVGNN